MTRTSYLVIAIISLVMVAVLTFQGGANLKGAGVWLAGISYSIFVAAIHGIIAHTLPEIFKAKNMFFPIIMGILFAILLAIFIYLILPSFIFPYTHFFRWRT
jgi:hypothetical protein